MLSVDPAVDDGRMSDHNRATACPNAASPNHATRADYCARFRGTQGDDASQQQQRNDRVLHCYSPGVETAQALDAPPLIQRRAISTHGPCKFDHIASRPLDRDSHQDVDCHKLLTSKVCDAVRGLM